MRACSEVGEHYLAEEWGQQLMTVADFIKQHIAPAVNPQPQHDREATVLAAGTARGGDSGSNGGAAGVSDNGRGEAAGDDSSPAARMLEGGGNQAQEGKAVAQDAATSGHVVRRGYLAQHALFEQIPALAADIRTPEYCVLGKDEEEGGGVQAVNAWFGPPGTVTPLHTDPKHNLLCQVRRGLHTGVPTVLDLSSSAACQPLCETSLVVHAGVCCAVCLMVLLCRSLCATGWTSARMQWNPYVACITSHGYGLLQMA